MEFMLLILYLALITPVKLGAAVSAGGGPPEAAVGVMLWGFKRVAHIRLWRQGDALRLCAESGGRSVLLGARPGSGWSGKAIKALIRGLTGPQGRRVLRLTALDGLIQIGGQDAARTALLTGAVRGLLGAGLPQARICCRPAFGGPSLLRLRCIAQARLGTILAAGLLTALGMRRAGRKEEGAWIIPSDN